MTAHSLPIASALLFLTLVPFSAQASISSGTGFVITKDGLVVTNDHVVGTGTRYQFIDATKRSYQARLIARDRRNDLALLQVDGGHFPPLKLRPSATIRKGEAVLTVGYPHPDIQGVESKVTEGIINSFSGLGDDQRYYQMSVPIQQGNSGGALATMDGTVVGIVVSKLSASYMLKYSGDLPQNVNYAIKTDVLLAFLSSIGEGHHTTLSRPKRDMPLVEVAEIVEAATGIVFSLDTEPTASAAPLPKKHQRESRPNVRQDAPSPPVRLDASRPPREIFKDCTDCPEMTVVPGGTIVGERRLSSREKYPIEIKKFSVGRYEVTFAEWEACVRESGCSYSPDDNGWGRERRPVINVSWNDAQQYVRWLRRKTGYLYRLVTRAEFEYLVTEGTGQWPDLQGFAGKKIGNCVGCESEYAGKSTAPVGSFVENVFKVYDLIGNVWEWQEDCSGTNDLPEDGSATRCGQLDPVLYKRVYVGLGWSNLVTGKPSFLSTKNWIMSLSDNDYTRNTGIGFRVARQLLESPSINPRGDRTGGAQLAGRGGSVVRREPEPKP